MPNKDSIQTVNRGRIAIGGIVEKVDVREYSIASPAFSTLMERRLAEAMGAGGPRTEAVAIVIVGGHDGRNHPILFSEENWERAERFLRRGRDIHAEGFVNSERFEGIPRLAGYVGALKNPTEMTIFGVNHSGTDDDMLQSVISKNGYVEERPQLIAVQVKAFCLRCKESVCRSDVRHDKFANGRAYTVGTCERCGTDVYRTGSVNSELVDVSRVVAA